MTRHKQFPRVISYFLLFMVLLGVTGVAIGVNLYESRSEEEKVARVEVDLNGTTLEEMKAGSKETKYTDNQVKISEQGVERFYDNVEIKGRGNLTWIATKKPWQIKFAKKTDLLGITRAKKWAFLAEHFDKSHIRNDLAMKIAEMVGKEYNHRGKFAEVYFDGEYEGLFYILPKVEIGKGVVDLKDEMGVLVEMDNMRRDVTDVRYSTFDGNTLLLADAVSDDEATRQAAMQEFLTDFNLLEKYAQRGDYEKAEEVADLESFAEYYLVSEFTANPDAYTTSFYFYKNGAEDQIHAGPMWDFDLAFGNPAWGELSATETMERRADVFGEDGSEPDMATSRLVYNLMMMPKFQELVKKVYREKMAGRKNELISEAKRTVGVVRDTSIRDSEKWHRGDFDVEVEKVLNWIDARYDYFEKIYGETEEKVEKSVI